jgi:uncharacterized protein
MRTNNASGLWPRWAGSGPRRTTSRRTTTVTFQRPGPKSVFVDTSAFYAVLVANDRNHPAGAAAWRDLLERQETLVTSSYVLVETCALLQSRIGLSAVRTFQADIMGVVGIQWVEVALHNEGMNALLTSDRRRLSLVDCVSFALMRRLGIAQAFAFDPHFAEHGFACCP